MCCCTVDEYVRSRERALICISSSHDHGARNIEELKLSSPHLSFVPRGCIKVGYLQLCYVEVITLGGRLVVQQV